MYITNAEEGEMPNYWLMAPFNSGEVAQFEQVWNYDRTKRVISIGWDVGQFDSPEQMEEEYWLEVRRQITRGETKPWTTHGLDQLKTFWYEIKAGDWIVARRGLRKILGAGEVTGPPFYNREMAREQAGKFPEDHAYFLPVNWTDCEKDLPPYYLRKWITLYPIKESVFRELVGDEGIGLIKDATPARYGSDLASLSQRTYLTEGFLQEIVELLEDKKQVIFQGPPGTGKTYVAQELAECLAGSKERVTLVQFHPSYAYEDFVEGIRPRIQENDQVGFALHYGPLLQAAGKAKDDTARKHFLVIDEINRGNLAKVFGELYFLLEYRNRPMNLQYSGEPFSLPENLYIIGTMNTADRSIALVDLALRRRFYFVEFHPDDEPVKGVLRRYLGEKAPDMEWVADVVERANVQLQKDRDAAIGPSYFMKDNLTEESVQRIWKHNVLPYIKELLYGRNEELEIFNLDALKRGTASGSDGAGVGEEDESSADTPTEDTLV